MVVSNFVGLTGLFSFFSFFSFDNSVNFDKLRCFRRKSSIPHNVFVFSGLFLFLYLSLSFYLDFVVIDNDYDYYYELHKAYGHFFGTTDSALTGAQNQTTGNYIVELLLNPSKPMVDKDTSFLMQVKSTTGDALIELPAAFYILKDGKPVYSNANNYTIVKQGHHDFNYTFNEPGKYILFVDIKDIFYTLDTLSVKFEINVQAPILNRLSDLIVTFVANYYYIYIPVLALITISYAIRLKRHRS